MQCPGFDSLLRGPGTFVSTATIDCHTIGTDYGEFNQKLTCPIDANKDEYKSTWFRIDIGGTDTLDITAYINQQTNAFNSDIQYRLMTGDCSAMQEQSCVQDAQTQNTYKCLAPGKYYIQVFVPVVKFGSLVKGTINLNLIAVKHKDTCAPAPNCLANANFIAKIDCNKDEAVYFNNYSTYGSNISYQWSFGYNNQTSTAVAPSFVYPAKANDTTYNVKLVIKNGGCSGKDSITIPVKVPGRPVVNLGKDTTVCKGNQLLLDATTHPGSTYQWSTGEVTPDITVNTSGTNQYFVDITYNNCTVKDTIDVTINPIAGKTESVVICTYDSAFLISYRGYNESYQWSTGATDAGIYTKIPGIYYNTVKLYGCSTIDTFNVLALTEPFKTKDTTVCLLQPLTLDATTPGAFAYSWQDGSAGPTYDVTVPGLYYVTVSVGNCSVTDSVVVHDMPLFTKNIATTTCSSQGYTLPSGVVVTTSGIYEDTVRYKNGCDSLITTIDLTVITGAGSDFSFQQDVCNPKLIKFTASNLTATINWDFGNGQTATNNNSPSVTYANYGNYLVKMIITSGSCKDTIKKTIPVFLDKADIIITPDTSICPGSSVKLVTDSGIAFCWRPDATINNVNIANTTVKPTVTTTYYFNSKVTGSNLISNGDFSNGDVDFTSDYSSVSNNTLEAEYTVGSDPSLWNGGMSPCPDHTTGTGQMMLVNGSPNVGDVIWRQTVAIAPNTNYAFSTWVQSLFNQNPANLKFVINGEVFGNNIQAVTNTCIWKQFYTTWNSGIATSAEISIINNNTSTLGNDFALDDISFSPVSIRYDSIKVTVLPTPVIKSIKDTTICVGTSVTLTTTGGQSYSWTPTTGLSNPSISNPVATPANTTRYIVKGLNANGCVGLDTVDITIVQKPQITVTKDTSKCEGSSLQLLATGAFSYSWSPTTGLNSTVVANPVSTATTPIKYYVTGTSAQGCTRVDSVTVGIKGVTKTTKTATICQGQSYTLPSGGTVTTAGTYNDTIKYKTGCDSLITTVTLTVKPVITKITTAAICAGKTFTLPSGTVVSTAGSYKDTIRYVGVAIV